MEHKSITGADNHEPKGVETATAGTVYTANGTGSGNWQSPTTGVNNANRVTLNTIIASVGGGASSAFVVSPYAGKLISMSVVLHGAITTADSIVTAKINGITVGSSSITVAQSGSAAGSVFSSSPATSNTVAANGAIEIACNGAATGAVAATVTLTINTA